MIFRLPPKRARHSPSVSMMRALGWPGASSSGDEGGAERGLNAEQREEVGRDGADAELLGIAVGVDVAAVVADGGDLRERLRLGAHVEEGRLGGGELVAPRVGLEELHEPIGRADRAAASR